MLTDYAAEQAVLGSLLLDSTGLPLVAPQLGSADFSVAGHRLLYRVLLELHAQDQPLDVLVVKRRMEAHHTLSSAEIVRLLTELADAVSTAAHLPQYVALVREAAQRRTLLAAADRMKQAALAGAPATQIAADSQSALDQFFVAAASSAGPPSAIRAISAGADGAAGGVTTGSAACWTPFPTDVLPAGLAEYVRAEAEATVVDESMVALPLLVALASAIGGARQAGVKRGWIEPCILWGALVAPASSGKTPAAKNVLRIVRDRDQQALRETRRRGAEHPPQLRYHLQDATPEQLLGVLEDNPRGVLVVRDELSGLFGGFGRSAEGRGAMERSRYLSIWSAEHLSDDRKTTRSLYVRQPHASLYGGVQPELLFRCLGDDDVAAGLPARFLFAWPPERPRVWSEAEVPSRLLDQVRTVFDRGCIRWRWFRPPLTKNFPPPNRRKPPHRTKAPASNCRPNRSPYPTCKR